MSSAQEWNPKAQASRPADNTESIHRTIAWIYGVLGAFVVLFAVANGHPQWAVAAALAVFFGAVVGPHAALAVGARRRSGLAKAGSMVVGILLLLGFPIGTIVGGMLICNAAQSWPPARTGPAAPAGPDMRLL